MADDDSLLREVNEELRRERMERLWKRYGNLFLALSLGVVAAVAGYKGWQYYQQQQAQAAGEAYVSALDLLQQNKRQEAIAALEKLAGGTHAGAAALAKLRLAALHAADGNAEKAVALYRSVADDKALDLPLRDAARVRHAWLLADSASREELAKLLGGLDVDGNPWRAAAREILALAALREGDEKTARDYLRRILEDPESPAEARGRATVLFNRLGGAETAATTANGSGNGSGSGSNGGNAAGNTANGRTGTSEQAQGQ